MFVLLDLVPSPLELAFPRFSSPGGSLGFRSRRRGRRPRIDGSSPATGIALFQAPRDGIVVVRSEVTVEVGFVFGVVLSPGSSSRLVREGFVVVHNEPPAAHGGAIAFRTEKERARVFHAEVY